MRLAPIKTMDLELGAPLPRPPSDLGSYRAVRLLLRLYGDPLATVTLPVSEGRPEGWPAELGPACAAARLLAARADPPPSPVQGLAAPRWPTLAVAVCTRDRPLALAGCLRSLLALHEPQPDLLVVDNGTGGGATERVVRAHPAVGYVREPRPGLDRARNRAIEASRGDILAFTDDDVEVDPGWARALADAFADHPEVGLVTGLVEPLELDTDAQVLFERYGGFGRGYARRWFRPGAGDRPIAARFGHPGSMGTGANMAFRRSVLLSLGGFDPALDTGTPSGGGGDLEMFFRVLKAGHTALYEPRALVRHRHRRTRRELRAQVLANGTGFSAYLARSLGAYPDERRGFARVLAAWVLTWHAPRLATALLGRLPLDLVLAEAYGALIGPGRYRRSRRLATRARVP